MTTTTHHETQIIADPDVPLVRITREFDAPVDEGLPRPRRPRAVRPVERAEASGRASTTSTAAPAGPTAT